jgi:hypothetical protein
LLALIALFFSLAVLTLAVIIYLKSRQNLCFNFQTQQEGQLKPKRKTQGMKKRVPYLELSDPRWRLDQAVSLLRELAGEGHDDQDFLQFMDD